MTDKTAPKVKKKGIGKLGLITIMVLFGFLSPFIMPTLTILFLGMIPTMIAIVTDNDRQKSSSIAVGSLNCAGVVPFVIDLWMKGQSMDNAFHILRDPETWLVMLGSAAMGQLIVFAIPQVLASLTTMRYEVRLKTLKENMESLKATWGPDVATTKPLRQMGQRE